MHNEERIFWKTMNPNRLSALYNSYFAMMQPREKSPAQSAELGGSLSKYLMGGGA